MAQLTQIRKTLPYTMAYGMFQKDLEASRDWGHGQMLPTRRGWSLDLEGRFATRRYQVNTIDNEIMVSRIAETYIETYTLDIGQQRVLNYKRRPR